MLMQNLKFDLVEVAEFCRRNHIRRMSIFGSAVRDDFGPESDVDVLVEFEPDKTPGLAFFGLADELSPIFGGRTVDLGTSVNRWVRARVLAEAQVIYETE
jgi:predicted nucleotidyltransferase